MTSVRDVALPRQFEVWWIALPEPVGRRPVLFMGRSFSFEYLDRVLVAEVTTTIRGIPQEVPLGRREGLPRSCVANLDALRTVPRVRFGVRIGRIAATRHAEIKRALGHVLHWPELTALAS
ncbi:MAG: type II toxin-antitoxin system PemK/MazF family toxin [Myxococcales bacterium]|nr:type II toxin-antitoxin system PemK/MazF family toxin [Myxococcales bacterium]